MGTWFEKKIEPGLQKGVYLLSTRMQWSCKLEKDWNKTEKLSVKRCINCLLLQQGIQATLRRFNKSAQKFLNINQMSTLESKEEPVCVMVIINMVSTENPSRLVMVL